MKKCHTYNAEKSRILFLQSRKFESLAYWYVYPYPVGTDQLLNVDLMLSLNFPQPSSMLIFCWEMSWWWSTKQWSTKNQLLNHNSTKNQQSLKLKYQCWKMVETRLTFGWFQVEKLFFGWLLLHFQLISQPNINVDIWLRNWSVPTR